MATGRYGHQLFKDAEQKHFRSGGDFTGRRGDATAAIHVKDKKSVLCCCLANGPYARWFCESNRRQTLAIV